ncbi:metallophosphoesterase [Ornithinibacillus halophilus]|uniref:Predicted phosphohydrolase, MPP superfamily n=1 Tax=Ornithinibacillus halophilus TaxID=930117 RepID=A0A1M5CS07_9BACI|nr:metallophosphoesterase [Ornithinibacillus halophilus]SHF57514.1 Predicted phosphohydrolase, MPP superfamily [Ornithinibacillus halophilus]
MTLLLVIVLLGLTLVFYMIYNAFHDKVSYNMISDKRLPESFNNFHIFFITDIHRRKIDDQTIQSIKDEIDVVVIGGDLTENGVPLKRTQDNIQKLKKWNAPIFFVWGNNDYEGFPVRFTNLLINEGVTILANKEEIIERNQEKIRFVGLDYSLFRPVNFTKFVHRNNELFTILLVHSPQTFEEELTDDEKNMVEFVLAGHTHGGQIRFFNFGPYEKGGLKKVRNTNLLVSEGYGYSLVPLRLETSAECHVITLKSN